MLSSRWRKILNDLWGNKTRTLLIVLSIAVGLFAVGTIVSSQEILSAGMSTNYAEIVPSTGTIRTLELFDDSFVRSVQAMENIADADARRGLDARVETAPGEWAFFRVFGIADYNGMRINKVYPQEGPWPPPEREILIERAALSVIGAKVGDEILVEMPDKKQRWLRVAGVAHDMAQLPAQIDGTPYGYVTFETLDWFGQPKGYNELYIVSTRPDDAEFSAQVVNEVKNKAERTGYTIPLTMTAEPGQLPLDDILQAILMMMGILGLLSLFLSVFLIINTVSALLAQQKRQIGVIKAIGASTGQLMGMYLGMVIIYGLLALCLAIPSSGVGAKALSQFMAKMFNFDLSNMRTPPQAVALQCIVGILVPILASLYPFVANLRISAAEAMSSFQLGKGRFGKGAIDRLLAGHNLWFARYRLMRPALLALRNIFRSKGRLLLTLITLVLGGAIFVSVFSVQASLDRTINDLMKLWNFDAMVLFSRPYRIARIREAALEYPGVTEADAWQQLATRRVRDDGSEGKLLFMFATRPESDMVPGPTIVEGRWLVPEDENAIVVDALLFKDEPDLALGSDLVLKIDGREQQFHIVGVSLGVMSPMSYANLEFIADATGNSGRATTVLVRTEQHDIESINHTIVGLEEQFSQSGLQVSGTGTMAQELAEAHATFGIVVNLLMVMAVLLAIVGGLGLMGTMSINVLERTREIGVLRAIGASNRGVSRVFILEGVVIGLLSWLLGIVLAVPMGKMLSAAVGIPMMGVPLTFSYSVNGVWIWLLLISVLSAIASFIPARNASRLTVREVLAYE